MYIWGVYRCLLKENMNLWNIFLFSNSKQFTGEIVRKQFKYFDVDDVMILYTSMYVAMHDAFYL